MITQECLTCDGKYRNDMPVYRWLGVSSLEVVSPAQHNTECRNARKRKLLHCNGDVAAFFSALAGAVMTDCKASKGRAAVNWRVLQYWCDCYAKCEDTGVYLPVCIDVGQDHVLLVNCEIACSGTCLCRQNWCCFSTDTAVKSQVLQYRSMRSAAL